MVSSIYNLLSLPPLNVAITCSGFIISISESVWISAPVTIPSPSNSIYAFFTSSDSDVFLIARDFKFMIISVTSSFTPGMELNSCRTPSIFTELMAAPGREESMILLRELPNVIPYPLSRGSTTNFPYFLSSEISVISIFGLLKSNTTQTLLMG